MNQEVKTWFIDNVTIGHKPEGMTLKELGLTQRDFGNPLEMAKEASKDPRLAFEHLRVTAKMLKLGAIATVESEGGKMRVHGQDAFFVPSFLVFQKNKPRLVTDYSKMAKVKREGNRALKKWLESAENRTRFKHSQGRISYNLLIPKNETTMSYIGLKDVASIILALGKGARLGLKDVSGSYHQIRQHPDRLPYQGKILFIPGVGGEEDKFLPFLLMGTEMGGASACAVGNLDTAIKLRLAEQRAEEEGSEARYRMSWKELIRPSAYGLKDFISADFWLEDIKEKHSKKRNKFDFHHLGGQRRTEYRYKSKIRLTLSFQDDMLSGEMASSSPGALARHLEHFYTGEIRGVLSTDNRDPEKVAIFCGILIEDQKFTFPKDKWERFHQGVTTVVEKEIVTGQEVMSANGMLANTGILFPELKFFNAIYARHIGKLIQKSILARNSEHLKREWRILLRKRYRVDKKVKKAIKQGWETVKGRSVHVRNFVVLPGDATTELSVDVSPGGIGIVLHKKKWEEIESSGYKLGKSPIIEREPWGEVASTSFELAGVAVATKMVPELMEATPKEDEFEKIVRVWQDNSGAECALDPTSPKFKNSYLAPHWIVQSHCKSRRIILVPQYMGTKMIPADAPSRMDDDGNFRTDLAIRMVWARLAKLAEVNPKYEIWRTNRLPHNKLPKEVLIHIATFLPVLRFSLIRKLEIVSTTQEPHHQHNSSTRK